jgi:hypothetical protein
LTRDQWAWEFLRRNPDYRTDYHQFMAIWRALEADYGAPPRRDFQRWKRDPRAYGPLPGGPALDASDGEQCMDDDERVLLECWMGAKWGFHKFPLDPFLETPPAADALSWRQPPPVAPRTVDDPYRLDIAFDLSLPLPPQLEAARFRLLNHAAGLRRTGLEVPRNVANQRDRWSRMLALLDGHAVADSDDAIACLREARHLVNGGYREIVRLADSPPDAP